MWTSLNTSTLKFAAIYNAIKQNPITGSLPDDWMSTAMSVYANQKKGMAFSSIAAWQQVWHCPKSQGDWPDLTLPIPLSNNIKIELGSSHPPAHAMTNWSQIKLSKRCPRSIGSNATKTTRCCWLQITLLKSWRKELWFLAREAQLRWRGTRSLMKCWRLRRRNWCSTILEAHKQSKTQMIDYKLLQELTDGKEEMEAEKVLQMMKKGIIHKWLSKSQNWC